MLAILYSLVRGAVGVSAYVTPPSGTAIMTEAGASITTEAGSDLGTE